MIDPPGLPDLSQLSSDEKNQLIASLYATLLAVEGQATALAVEAKPETRGKTQGQLENRARDIKNRIASSSPSQRSQTTRTPVPGAMQFLTSRPVQILLVMLVIGFAADFAIGWYERHLLDRQRQDAAILRSAAFDGLYVELVRVAYEKDGYRATLTMQKTQGTAPLYIMLSPIRAFVQVGLTWQEIPAEAASGTRLGVVKLDDAHDVSVTFQTDLKGWAELIPGYMHVRIDSQMLISRRSTPKDDLVERNNVFYVYLKPQDADDDSISRRSRFRGKPPVFIPMPPH